MYPLEGKSWFWPLVNTRLPPGFTQSVHLMGSRVHSDHERDWDPVIGVIAEHTVWSDHVTHTTEDCACVCVVCVPYAVARR